MFEMGTPAWGIVVRTAIVYLGIFAGLRLMGKRELGQMIVFDLVVILLIANAVQNAMVGPDVSLQGGLLAAAVLLMVNRGVAALRVHTPVGRLIQGIPTVLVRKGQYMDPAKRREEVDRDDIMEALREHGLESVEQVELAVLETDGSISIVPRSAVIHHRPRKVRQMRKR